MRWGVVVSYVAMFWMNPQQTNTMNQQLYLFNSYKNQLLLILLIIPLTSVVIDT